ncbi:caspase-13 [Latimeria chalumnae]|uniref:Caspase 1 n=1 Tax=Latimeria chalumnae TaxID=7897 RepID=H3B2V3_LATCH|nr:PREDICTED: caspase-13-like [Latimeria chalumnae]XP_005992300.1 PREDICTED: caspase-13-like [Latimeria chalumnae]XP_005992301.1 PREDICTED: caspase-13-like [Latimeria chalumnae]|eukprot:XP_005992299.1 PREDICTED: caspase-13-like [Latimeria chalumnae]
MAGERLKKLRREFADNVSKPVLDQILDDLLEQKVLNEGEYEALKEGSTRRGDKALELIDIVRKKGQKASEKFIQSIQYRDSMFAERLELEPDSSRLPQSGVVPVTRERPPASDQWIAPCLKKTFQAIQQQMETGQIYKIRESGSRKRTALIINNIKFSHYSDRNGANVDEQQMKKLLEGLGYTPKVYNNVNAKDMEKALTEFSKQEEHKESDSTFIVLMSHGIRDGVCGVEHKEESPDILHTDKIFNIFNNKNCKTLREKPKIIIIQACRGENMGHTLVSDSLGPSLPAPSPQTPSPSADIPEGYESDALRKDHVERDFICFCSSTPDNVSWRSPETGSVFVQKLVDVVRKNACVEHVDELFRMVQNEFENFPMQMPTKERNTLLKKFYLLPGI